MYMPTASNVNINGQAGGGSARWRIGVAQTNA